ncbi:PhnD/SsuA/transferrin family substrate-binding protein [Marinobacter zhanjiangensis]|uniref:PhnD/SsuA/transferrin family substrate-binding protein n=1 Tax=Marinobacter zhanjiangensis TaxID=578215 RepID=UPI001673E947|nr:PhnD/SsuA/transferrin family substrate-binding protein [Marinobacter zhanjiangensis]
MLIGIEPDGRVSEVARRRLEGYLNTQGCTADIRFNSNDPARALVFRVGIPGAGESPALVAVNSAGDLPQPAWITRRSAGVRGLAELEDRDLATVAGQDPLGAELPVEALRKEGVSPDPGQLYEAGDYSSALGLLLHNNTHAAVSELGFVEPFLDKNGLVVTWSGPPLIAAAWYRHAGWREAAANCEQALVRRQREDDRQAFAAFPEWVAGFARHDSQHSEDSSQ